MKIFRQKYIHKYIHCLQNIFINLIRFFLLYCFVQFFFFMDECLLSAATFMVHFLLLLFFFSYYMKIKGTCFQQVCLCCILYKLYINFFLFCFYAGNILDYFVNIYLLAFTRFQCLRVLRNFIVVCFFFFCLY